jgi:hypothetical protein
LLRNTLVCILMIKEGKPHKPLSSAVFLFAHR